jgi:hypothetical protein
MLLVLGINTTAKLSGNRESWALDEGLGRFSPGDIYSEGSKVANFQGSTGGRRGALAHLALSFAVVLFLIGNSKKMNTKR